MKLHFLFALVLGIARAFAGEPSPFSAISSYLSEPSGHQDIHYRSSGCTDYVLPAEVAKLVATRTVNELLVAIIYNADSVASNRAYRIADLVVVVLSRVQPVDDGRMSDEDRRAGAKVFRVPFTVDRALRRGFPKEATGWPEYYKAVVTQ